MLTRRRALHTAALAGLMLAGCEGPCLVPPCRVIDSFAAHMRLCGLPRQQLDGIGEASKGVLRVGQRITLRLEGDRDRVASVTWVAGSPAYAPNPPRIALERRSDSEAVLVGLAPGGTDPADFAWAYANLVFDDGTEGSASVAYCQGSDWTPAYRIVVR